MTTGNPSERFTLPDTLPPSLSAVLGYWDGLKRGWKLMPYWDDVRLPDLGDAAPHALMFNVMDKRFRFAEMGKTAAEALGTDLLDRFADEAGSDGALADLVAQAEATVAGPAPTYVVAGGYGRLLLPLWGDGSISMLLGGVAKA